MDISLVNLFSNAPLEEMNQIIPDESGGEFEELFNQLMPRPEIAQTDDTEVSLKRPLDFFPTKKIIEPEEKIVDLKIDPKLEEILAQVSPVKIEENSYIFEDKEIEEGKISALNANKQILPETIDKKEIPIKKRIFFPKSRENVAALELRPEIFVEKDLKVENENSKFLDRKIKMFNIPEGKEIANVTDVLKAKQKMAKILPFEQVDLENIEQTIKFEGDKAPKKHVHRNYSNTENLQVIKNVDKGEMAHQRILNEIDKNIEARTQLREKFRVRPKIKVEDVKVHRMKLPHSVKIEDFKEKREIPQIREFSFSPTPEIKTPIKLVEIMPEQASQKELISSLVNYISKNRNIDKVELTFHHDDLGAIHLEVQEIEKGMNIKILAKNTEGKQFFQGHEFDFRDRLESSGIKVNDLQLNEKQNDDDYVKDQKQQKRRPFFYQENKDDQNGESE